MRDRVLEADLVARRPSRHRCVPDGVDRAAVRESVADMRDDIDHRIQELVTTREALTQFLDQG
jgi:hypothetical protein